MLLFCSAFAIPQAGTYYTFVMHLAMLASAAYLVQKTGTLYKVAAGIIAIAAPLAYVIGHFVLLVSQWQYELNAAEVLRELSVLPLFGQMLIVSAAVVAAGFLAARMVRDDTRGRTTLAALLCGATYLVFMAITSAVIFGNSLAYTILVIGVGSIPDAVALGLAVKLVSLLCLFKSRRIQTGTGSKVWFGVCAAFTMLSLLATPLLYQVDAEAIGLAAFALPNYFTLLLTISSIVGYGLLLRSRRIGYVLVLIAVGVAQFGQIGFNFTQILAETLDESIGSASFGVYAFGLLFSLAALAGPAITGAVLSRAWKTAPVEAPFDKPRVSPVFMVGSLVTLLLSLILLIDACGGYFNPASPGFMEAGVFFAGPLLWSVFTLVGLFATIACFYRQFRAPKPLLIANVALAALCVLFSVLILVIGESPYSADLSDRTRGASSSRLQGNVSDSGGLDGGNSDSNSNGDSVSDGASGFRGSGSDEQPSLRGETGGQRGFLPQSFAAYGNTYVILSFNIETNGDGNTIVKCNGTGFEVLPMRNGSFMTPVLCALIADGDEIACQSTTTSSDGVEFEFGGKTDADAVAFWAGDDESQRVEIPIK
jgi:hypothetical protein